jgi:hypothetical protein
MAHLTLSGRVYLDTNIFIYALEGYPAFRAVLTTLFAALDRSKKRFLPLFSCPWPRNQARGNGDVTRKGYGREGGASEPISVLSLRVRPEP